MESRQRRKDALSEGLSRSFLERDIFIKSYEPCSLVPAFGEHLTTFGDAYVGVGHVCDSEIITTTIMRTPSGVSRLPLNSK